MIQVGLIGAGTIGAMHAKHLAREIEGARLAAVADVHEPSARRVGEARGARWTTDWRALLADREIDAVAICSATATHAEIVEAAAKAGKHIFVEKPIARELTDADRALAAVRAAGVVFQIGFQRRFDPGFARVKQAIDRGELGRVHVAHLISRDPGPPEAGPLGLGGGVWFDMMIHDLDMARWLAGSEAASVFTQADTLIEPKLAQFDQVDVAVVLLRMQNGAIITIENHTDSPYGYDQRAEVIGSKASAAVGNVAPHNAVIGDAAGFHSPRPLPYFLERYAPVYRDELQAFVDCVGNGTPSPVGIDDARQSLRMALAAQQSFKERRVVTLA